MYTGTRAGFEIQVSSGDQPLRLTRQVLNAPPEVVRIFGQFFKFE